MFRLYPHGRNYSSAFVPTSILLQTKHKQLIMSNKENNQVPNEEALQRTPRLTGLQKDNA